ncbi:MAG: ChaN family lipoprotein [Gammaproteobacteria bacterium]|nr:ChaN family lipoprotein [Gammaproteobacteria bacterium]
MNIFARICVVTGCLLLSPFSQVWAVEASDSCDHLIAQWLDPASGETLASDVVFKRLEKSRIVLLGESHTTREHHRWQQYTLSALHSRNSNMVLGFEMLPRSKQAALDAWSAGKLSEKEFLEQSDWQKIWGYDAGLYLPLLHFARLNRLPTIALNIDRELVSRVGEKGWQGLPEAERSGLSDPAPASNEYRELLAQLYAYKQSLGNEVGQDKAIEPDLEEVLQSDAFSNFVDAQLTWDRAMAEELAAAHRRDPAALVVGIVGRGHLEYGYGIPHQLADMGIDDVDVLLPIDSSDGCDSLPADLAHAVFVVATETDGPVPQGPRLGVMIESGDNGVRVMQVVADSVAAKSGILEGDVIQSAAGFKTATNAELIEIIQRQAPGTWLPLTLLRGDKTIALQARFPQSFE